MSTGANDRNAQVAAHAAFYFITVILDTLRRKGLMSAEEIARAIDAYPHEDANVQGETRAFLHRCMALIETVPVSPPVAPAEEGQGEEEVRGVETHGSDEARTVPDIGEADDLVRFIDEKDPASERS